MTLIDFDFLNEIADGDPSYICDVIDIFIDTVPPGIENLSNLIKTGTDWDAIYKQSHALKSSLGIVKIGNLLDEMAGIELNAMAEKDTERARATLHKIVSIFNEAYPVLLAEKAKYEAKRDSK